MCFNVSRKYTLLLRVCDLKSKPVVLLFFANCCKEEKPFRVCRLKIDVVKVNYSIFIMAIRTYIVIWKLPFYFFRASVKWTSQVGIMEVLKINARCDYTLYYLSPYILYLFTPLYPHFSCFFDAISDLKFYT